MSFAGRHIVLALWGMLIACSSLRAGYQGVGYELVSSSDSTHTYRVYAYFGNASDELIALYGSSLSPWTLTLNGQLVQSEYGGALGTDILAAGVGVFPGLTEDSWFTLGSENSDGTSAIQQAGLTEALAAFEAGEGFVVDNVAGGGMFIVPGSSADALAGDDLKVLLAQFTLTGTATLQFNLQWKPQGGLIIDQTHLMLTIPEEVGCTNAEACNYDASALVDDGSCSFTSDEYFDCNGTCLNDADSDGVCDELEVQGCTLSNATNYDVSATEDDGTCIVLGCTNATASNYDQSATEDDASCFWLGCTDPLAGGYSEEATVDDGSCMYPDPSYTGLAVEEVVAWEASGDVHVHRVYATFSNPLDELVAVFGNAEHPLHFNSGTSFAQDPDGVAGFWGAGDSAAFQLEDSWLALGTAGDAVNLIGIQAAILEFESGENLNLESGAGGMWFLYPGSGFGQPDENGRVLLGQFASTGWVDIQLNLQYRAQSGETVQALSQQLTFPEVAQGCLNASACSYDGNALIEDGSCEFTSCLGCTDSNACNFDADATQDDENCEYPEQGFDCEGNCLADADADGICDEFEVPGCTNSAAVNFSENATDDDGTCAVEGCTDETALNFDAEANTDNGSCAFLGCLDPLALNYDVQANVPDDCVYPAPGYEGLSWEEVGTSEEGLPVYRVYVTFSNEADELIGVFGNAQSPGWIRSTLSFQQTMDGQDLLSQTASSESLEGDSWLTLGSELGSNAISGIGLDEALESFGSGASLELDSEAGGLWFLLPSDSSQAALAFPDGNGRVLIAQLISEGQIDLSLNLNYRAPDGSTVMVLDQTLTFPNGVSGCMDSTACNYDASATLPAACVYAENAYDCDGVCLADEDQDGVCDELEVLGCTDANACNWSEANTEEDGSCLFASYATDCNGNCVVDTDGDGICEDLEVTGCSDVAACNYEPLATEEGPCWYSTEGYNCNGVCISDVNENGICDIYEEVAGCFGEECCGDGAVWDEVLQECVITNPFDSNLDGCVGLHDLFDFLTVFGTCNSTD